MKFLVAISIVLTSITLFADESFQISNKATYLQKLAIIEALDSIKSGESTEVILQANASAMSATFYVFNPLGLLDAPSNEAKVYARSNAEYDCKNITGIGELTNIIDSADSCKMQDGWPELTRKYWLCSAAVAFSCRITKP